MCLGLNLHKTQILNQYNMKKGLLLKIYPLHWVVCTEELQGILSGGYGAQCKVEYKFKDTKNYIIRKITKILTVMIQPYPI